MKLTLRKQKYNIAAIDFKTTNGQFSEQFSPSLDSNATHEFNLKDFQIDQIKIEMSQGVSRAPLGLKFVSRGEPSTELKTNYGVR